MDQQLDRATSGPLWLRDGRIAGLIVSTLLAGEAERGFYQLGAYVVMPNHIHLVLLPAVDLAVITRWL